MIRKRRKHLILWGLLLFLFLIIAILSLIKKQSEVSLTQKQLLEASQNTALTSGGSSDTEAYTKIGSVSSSEGRILQKTTSRSQTMDGSADLILTDAKIIEIQSSNKWKKIMEDAASYPEDLIRLLKRNPEMLEFVEGYLTADAKATGGITEEEKAEKCPLFIQWDERWGYAPYGQINIGISGCGPTCLSMVLYSLTRDENLTPNRMAEEAMAGGYYIDGTGTAWTFMRDIAPEYGVYALQTVLVSEKMLQSYLDAGNLVICSMGPGDFTDTGHFIVLTGYSNGKFSIHDPLSYTNSSLLWDYETIAEQCVQMWAYELIDETK